MDSGDSVPKSEHNSTPVSGFLQSSIGCLKERETQPGRDRPCDVTLMADNGKKFEAHRDVLAQSSPFFKRLFSTDMKESNEGVVRLEILSEAVLKDVLEFIYTDTIDMLAQQDVEALIAAADYLLLSKLKTLAERFLKKKVCVSNCLSYLDLAEKYQCQELADFTKHFANANFAVIGKSEEFLNLSSREVERWISSDEIVVAAEEDVFKIIRRWIKHKKNERKEKLYELFRHVRLIYVSREYLSKKVVKTSLVKNNEQCLASVTSAINWLDHARRELDHPRPQSIRKSLEKHSIVIAGKRIVCYLPDTDTWYELPKSPSKPNTYDCVVSVEGKVEKFSIKSDAYEVYDPYLNHWTTVTNSSISIPDPQSRWDRAEKTVTGEHVYLHQKRFHWGVMGVKAWKYNKTSDSWRSVPLPDLLWGLCVVFLDKYVYVMGGCGPPDLVPSARSARFDTSKDEWKEIADMQTARLNAFGVAAHGKIFVIGGHDDSIDDFRCPRILPCEVYNIQTNEWQFIATMRPPRDTAQVLCHGSKLYVVGGDIYWTAKLSFFSMWSLYDDVTEQMQCYDIEKDKWSTYLIPKRALFKIRSCDSEITACSVTIPKKTLASFQKL